MGRTKKHTKLKAVDPYNKRCTYGVEKKDPNRNLPVKNEDDHIPAKVRALMRAKQQAKAGMRESIVMLIIQHLRNPKTINSSQCKDNLETQTKVNKNKYNKYNNNKDTKYNKNNKNKSHCSP